MGAWEERDSPWMIAKSGVVLDVQCVLSRERVRCEKWWSWTRADANRVNALQSWMNAVKLRSGVGLQNVAGETGVAELTCRGF